MKSLKQAVLALTAGFLEVGCAGGLEAEPEMLQHEAILAREQSEGLAAQLDASVNGCTGQVNKLYRHYKPSTQEHFYTTDYSESRTATTTRGFTSEGIVGHLFESKFQPCGALPLHRYLNASAGDHLYTTNRNELGDGNSQWAYERVEGYCFPTQVTGTIPLYRLFSPAGTDHFYTTNWTEAQNAANSLGYTHEGVACYIYPLTEDLSTRCNVPVSSASGGDIPFVASVQLGKPSGSFRFTYNTQSVKDRLVVKYQGTTLYDSGCVGTNTSTSVVLSYSGTQSNAIVEVYPNCEQSSSTTVWDFTVSCP